MLDLSLHTLQKTATAYEELLVTSVFKPWTAPMAEAARIRAGQRVLDVACGTGALARQIADRVGPDGSVVGLDINPGMLGVAERLAPNIEWRRGEAESLPFDDRSFDAVVNQFGLMFFADREAALRQMYRVLAPGGRLAVAVFDGLETNRAYARMAAVFAQQAGEGVGAALRSPFVFDDREQLLSLFSAAGIDSAVVASEEVTESFASIRHLVLSDVEGWFPLAGIELDQDTIERVIGEAGEALAPYVTSDGAVAFPVRAHIVTATKA